MIPGKAIITLILQAILVVIAVFVFSIFDPFNIFNSKKLRLKDTPSIVNSIQGIGQLITAEYYGEVIKGSGEALEIMIDSSKANDRKRLLGMYDEITDALAELKFGDGTDSKKSNKRQVFKRFHKGFPSIVDNPDYGTFLSLIDKKYDLSEKQFLFHFYDNDEAELDTYPVGRSKTLIPLVNVINEHIEKKYATTRSEQRKIANNSLVLLGRGWVKVGFDFSDFDEKYFNYLPDRNLIRLKNHKPKIISATINPWFIPERKMKGFEYLYVGKKLNRNADDPDGVKAIQDLKAKCLENLINDAMDAGILETAQQQAEITLGQFFSLLLEKEITVRIYADPKDVVAEDILSDSIVSAREIQTIDSTVGRYAKDDLDATFGFLQSLNYPDGTFRHKSDPEKLPDNLETLALYYKVADDGFLSSAEHSLISSYVADTSISIKDYLYFTKTNKSTFLEFSFDNGMITASTNLKASVRDHKTKNRRQLSDATQALRRKLTSFELYRCDSILSAYVTQNNFTDALKFTNSVATYLTNDEPWKDANNNWKILAIYNEGLGNGGTAKTVNVLEGKLSPQPRKVDYFYHLYATRKFSTDSIASIKRLKQINSNGSLRSDPERPDQELIALRQMVIASITQSRDSLRHFLRQSAK